MSFVPTGEQLHAVELLRSNRVIKLEAGAGCTKTTTLSLMAGANKVESIYMAFNKKMAEEAEQKFQHWVKCQTTHSLAYGVYGAALNHKLKRPAGPYKNVCGTGGEIAKYYKIRSEYFCDDGDEEKLMPAASIGVAVKETLARFESSADEILSEKHVSFKPAARIKNDLTFSHARYKHTVLAYAALLWKERSDSKSPVLATHDTYLKLYQLSQPDLSHYEILYLDEMQDSSDCVIDIIRRQTKSKIVVVGDDAQAIYGWRGAVSAMKKFDGVVGQLTTSFRFGPAVAAEARMVLGLRTEGGMDLKGWDGKVSHVYDALPDHLDKEPRCQLYRTNAALIADGVEFILQGRKVSLEIDTKDFTAKLDSVVALREGNIKGVKHEDVVPYPSWKALVEEIKHVGGDLARIVKMVASGEHRRALAALAMYRKPEKPDLILTTAHKAKGREFEIVVLANDFPSVYDDDGAWIGLEDAEANLLYVGLTRAMSVLVRNDTLRAIRSKLGIEDDPNLDHLFDEVDDIEAANDALAQAFADVVDAEYGTECMRVYVQDDGYWRENGSV